MKILFALLLSVICCCHLCLGNEDPGKLQTQGNCINGPGTMTFYDGTTYVGQFKDGEMQGRGSITFPDGSRYEGEFLNGEIHGQGGMTFSDGSEYVGEFENGALCGHGTITFPDGGKYEGQFKDDKYHGKGVWTSPFGIRYEGQFKDGEFDGQGICTLPDGSRYIGAFKEDNFHGHGARGVDNPSFQNKSDAIEPVRRNKEPASEADIPDASPPPFAEKSRPGDEAANQGEDITENIISALETEDGEDFESKQNEISMAQGPYTDDGGTYASSGLAFSVQVGAFLSKRNAEKLAALLREKGYEAYLSVMDDFSKRPWYTVRIGSHTSLEKAQEEAGAFSEKEKMTATVRPFDAL